ncbi:hypothetical protein AVEN_87597-1 [Araneus ventricosus]|uniref:Uncharacterized protein n=1 Tax=Araneus ventricosus TaxID=182803 RepID=A0A4Y2LR53_ARAVE|nr:hypothetical protein AVEN_87597-1 [Araneus ventricosus]
MSVKVIIACILREAESVFDTFTESPVKFVPLHFLELPSSHGELEGWKDETKECVKALPWGKLRLQNGNSEVVKTLPIFYNPEMDYTQQVCRGTCGILLLQEHGLEFQRWRNTCHVSRQG